MSSSEISESDHRSGPSREWLGLDIGGANIKAAHSSGRTFSLPFEVWKHPEDLSEAIVRVTSAFPATRNVALTMTAELCDCYPSKIVGVNSILDSAIQALPRAEIKVWGIDREFHSCTEIRERPLLAAAANWLALAACCAEMIPNKRGLLIDIGTTTTDLIPLDRGRPVPVGRTDTERLQSGELVYAGTRRTPVCALATELEFRGRPTGLAAELFATTLDVYLTLGLIAPDPSDLATADGRSATIEAARSRLARMVGADLDGFTPEDAHNFATAADRSLRDRLLTSAERVCTARIGRPDCVIVAGSGEFLARRLADHLVRSEGPSISLEESWGKQRSSAACAYALVLLAAKRIPNRIGRASQ